MKNVNGLLIDENGTIRGIELAISDCPVTGLPRKAYHAGFADNRDLQMVQRIGVVTLSADGSKTADDYIKEVIVDDRRKYKALERYRDEILEFNTAGAFVDPKTGAFVEAGTEGAMEQLAYLQQITPAMLKKMGMTVKTDGSTSVLLMKYMMYVAEIQKQDRLGRL